MIKKIIFICSVCLIGCTQHPTKKLLLSKNVQLVAPRIELSNHLIDSSVTLNASLKIDNVSIYYTVNGNEPTKNSLKFTNQLKIAEPGIYQFKAFHPSLIASEKIAIEILRKGKTISNYKWLTNANMSYEGQGPNTLFNHTKAKVNFSNKQWVGFDTIAKSTIEFKNRIFIKSIEIGYLTNPSSWIFPPREISYQVSKDGIHFSKIETITISALEKNVDQKMDAINIPINQEIKVVKIEVQNVTDIPKWHEGNGKKAWLFMDEWIFN